MRVCSHTLLLVNIQQVQMERRAGPIKRLMKYFHQLVRCYVARDLRSDAAAHTKTHAGLRASSMTYPCDRVSSSYIVMTEDLTWQQTQSADPFCDEAAIQEKQTEAVCLGWTADPGPPVIQVGWFFFRKPSLIPSGVIRIANSTRPPVHPHE